MSGHRSPDLATFKYLWTVLRLTLNAFAIAVSLIPRTRNLWTPSDFALYDPPRPPGYTPRFFAAVNLIRLTQLENMPAQEFAQEFGPFVQNTQ